ncbi:hypothetical protein pipiens_016118, partial [Culex pipiens pipiens]
MGPTKFTLWLCDSMANGHNSALLTFIPGAASGPFGPIPDPVCGQIAVMMDSCFNNTTPPVSLDLLYTVKIPDSMEDVSSRC